MWLFLPFGFFSIVAGHDPLRGDLLVRARAKLDLGNFLYAVAPKLAELGIVAPKIVSSPKNDYPYRVMLPRAIVASVLAEHIETMQYGNFKDEVARVQGASRSSLYHEVWSTMHGIDPRYGERTAHEALAAHERLLVPGVRVRVCRGIPEGMVGTIVERRGGHNYAVRSVSDDGLTWEIESRNLEIHP